MTADYTFVNERLARHYGIPNVYGTHFRRVTLKDETRRGLLGKGAVLMVTSHPHRTSPVLRGKWILENVLGSPPPPPPDVVPPFEEDAGAAKPKSVRERMEQHRRNPACASCHRMIDPGRSGARELRRGRRLAHEGWRDTRRPGGCVRPAGRWYADQWGRRASRRLAAGSRDLRPDVDRKADDLRARPRIDGH